LKTYDKTNKCTEVLDEIEKIVISLKTQIEEAKEIEEDLKIQLTKKEETCHMLELEIVNLKKKNEKTMSNSITAQPSWMRSGTVKDQLMTKLVLSTIRKKKVASGTPFTNMRKDYPQKEKVQSQTKYKP
jgi:hypothetical protein